MTNFDDVKMTKHLTSGQIREELEHFEARLMARPELRHEFSSEASWHLNFEKAPGVYAAWVDEELVYVGETSNLRRRMYSLRDARTHTLRRQCDLDGWTLDMLSFRAVTVWFGRIEVEKHIIRRHKPRFCTHGR